MIAAAAAAAAGGCKAKEASPVEKTEKTEKVEKVEKAPDCEATLAGAVERMVADAKRTLTGDALARLEANAPRLRQTLHTACVADEWSAAALRCFSAATLQADLDMCTGKITHEQWVRLRPKIDPLLGVAPVAVASPTPEPPTPAAPKEVAAGSGAAGSAAGGAGNAAAARPPARPPAPQPNDCSKMILDPWSTSCRKQFCRNNPVDIRCSAE